MKSVTSVEIEEWLDQQIEAVRLQSIRLTVDDETGDYLSNLSHTSDSIHLVGEAIRFVADVLRLELYARKKDDDTYPYEIAVIYNGYKFFALETEEQYKERGAVV